MKFNLHFVYCSLFLISITSSSLLFLIVASAQSTKDASETIIANKIEETTENSHDEIPQTSISPSSLPLLETLNQPNNLENLDEHLENIKDIQHNIELKLNAINAKKIASKNSFKNIENEENSVPKINSNCNTDTNNDGVGTETDSQSEGDANVVVDEKIQNIPVNPTVIRLGETKSDFIRENSEDFENELLNKISNDITNKSFLENQQITSPSDSLTNQIKTNDFVILSEIKSVKRETIFPHEIPPDEENIENSSSSSGSVGGNNNIINNDIGNNGGSGAGILLKNNVNVPTNEQLENNDNNITTKEDIPVNETNLTSEENPIPVFSEWAQKQMEEAEKQLEKDVVNSSIMKKNATNGNKPQSQMLKLRAKNYASPDCGAKIIASNIEAQNIGALLTTSKDEYMLSPCTNRIWFVVELCEAIQAKQVDLANFELFSSSPKNFTVAVNNRYPTREWSNVGRFIAEDSRNIQSFELFPHLFGKYVRVDIHSHYNSEHFCPISLFRVYGTSEYEAFETENRHQYGDIDDDDDDDNVIAGNNNDDNNFHANAQDGSDKKDLRGENQNLFKSASDAVMSIVKKAAQVLSKDKVNLQNHEMEKMNMLCITPKFETFQCHDCSQTFVNKVNVLLSCKYHQLNNMLTVEPMKFHLVRSQICANRFNIDINNNINNSNDRNDESTGNMDNLITWFDRRMNFHLNLIPLDYLAGVCHISRQTNILNQNKISYNEYPNNAALNLTIDKKSNKKDGDNDDENSSNDDIFIDENNYEKNKKKHSVISNQPVEDSDDMTNNLNNNDMKEDIALEFPAHSNKEDQEHKHLNSNENIINDDGVNIFNLVDKYDNEDQTISPTAEESMMKDPIIEAENLVLSTITTVVPPIQQQQIIPPKQKDVDVESPSWDTIDKFLSEQAVGTGSTGGDLNGLGNANVNGNSAGYQNNQHKGSHHSESVFIRLSNRIKALERNMSLSGQYLEELSRRYKKQVEELQTSFSKTLNAIEDQNRRAIELEQFLVEQNQDLKANLEYLSQKFYFWITILICVVTIVLIHVLISWYSVSTIGKKQGKLLQKYEESSMVQCTLHQNKLPKKMERRKSVEDISGNPTPIHKLRRPSEEAMKIVGSYKDLLIFDEGDIAEECNGSNSIYLNQNDEISSTSADNSNEFSWSQKKLKSSQQRQRKPSVFYTKDKQPLYQKFLLRQESAPGDFVKLEYPNLTQQFLQQNSNIPEDDYENFMPGNDLAYNEFMPDGPFSESFMATKSTKLNSSFFSKKKSSKFRRLSSPGFLKSPFNKTSSSSIENVPSKKTPQTESTGWEWYRLKKSSDHKNNLTITKTSITSIDNSDKQSQQQQQQQPSISNNKNVKIKNKSELIVRLNNNGTGGSSGSSNISKNISTNSESEFLVLNYSSNNSENGSLRTTNSEDLGIGSVQSDGSGIVSNLSTTTVTNGNAKRNAKKQRSFKKIFKKVF